MEISEEEIDAIPAWPGYFATRTGRIFSNKRGELKEKAQFRHRKYPRHTVHLTDPAGLGRCVPVHRLVLETFVGPRPEGKVCRHLDGNPENNNLDNLSYGTLEENAQDSLRHGSFPVGERNGNAKLTAEQVKEIRALSLTLRRDQIAKKFGVGWTLIDDILKGKFWKHI